MGRIRVLLVATKEMPGLRNSVETLAQNGYDYRIIGMGQKWEGWRQRMQWYLEAADEFSKDHLDGIVVCMDAYDAISLRPQSDAFQTTFDSFGKSLVLGLERSCGSNCVPITEWWNDRGRQFLNTEGKPPRDQYVNGGLLAGRASAIRDLYAWMLKSGATDDQMGLGTWALEHPDAWAPDVLGLLFKNRIWGEPLEDEDANGHVAFFAHFPGSAGGDITGYDAAVQQRLNRPSGLVKKPTQTALYALIVILAVLFAIVFVACILFVMRHPLVSSRRPFAPGKISI